jgi:hypothetical protein
VRWYRIRVRFVGRFRKEKVRSFISSIDILNHLTIFFDRKE